jgi:hypothetical protein
MKTISNRLKSIYYDSSIVDNLCGLLPNVQLVANLRCGIWYCKDQDVKTCYFKSTDGHNNQWNFNLQRLNIDILKLAFTKNGVIIVDSTTNHRKVYPDALSKTIPIWAYVMNVYMDKLLNIEKKEKYQITLPRFVQENERNALIKCLEKNIEKWVSELMKNVDVNTSQNIIEFVLASGNKRFMPMFVSSLDLFDENQYRYIIDNNNIPIICLSVGNNDSVYVENQLDRQFQYILGAGDDEEMWSNGLTSQLFWKNPQLYLNCSDDEIIKNMIMSELINNNRFKEISILSLLEDKVTFITQPIDNTHFQNMFSIKVHTSTANFKKNIGNYNLKCNNCILDILDKTNTAIENLVQFNITHIEFICNDFKISLAVLVSIMVNFKDICFNSDLYLKENEPITKQYIRKIISYLYQFTGPCQIPRDFCKQLNKYYIEF